MCTSFIFESSSSPDLCHKNVLCAFRSRLCLTVQYRLHFISREAGCTLFLHLGCDSVYRPALVSSGPWAPAALSPWGRMPQPWLPLLSRCVDVDCLVWRRFLYPQRFHFTPQGQSHITPERPAPTPRVKKYLSFIIRSNKRSPLLSRGSLMSFIKRKKNRVGPIAKCRCLKWKISLSPPPTTTCLVVPFVIGGCFCRSSWSSSSL